MLEQYLRAKEEAGSAVLFFRLGDFYEMFFEDAERAAPILDVALTSRNRDDPEPIPMCGVPVHAVQGYIGRLLAAGLEVALCDQIGDPATSPGLVERALVRIITPGTILDGDEGLDEGERFWLCALAPGAQAGTVALATLEVASGDVRSCLAADEQRAREEIARIAPRELLLAPAPDGDGGDLSALATMMGLEARPARSAVATEDVVNAALERVHERHGDLDTGEQAALRAVLGHAAATLRGGLGNVRALRRYTLADHLTLDERTRRNLAIVAGPDGDRRGSLCGVLDQTATAMGSRRLRDWLLYPLLDEEALGQRFDAIGHLLDNPGLRRDLILALRGVGDLERLTGRVGLGRVGPRDVARLGLALAAADGVASVLASTTLPPFMLAAPLEHRPPAGLVARIQGTIADQPPVALADGGVIRDGADAEIDRLRALLRDARGHLAALETREREATGIASLRIRHHRALGWFFEVTKANLRHVPERWTRRQSLVSGERFSSPELLELERDLGSAEARCLEREGILFAELTSEIATHESELAGLARRLGTLDALQSLAEVAHRYGYRRPELHPGHALEIREGRHPVVERTSAAGRFVSNDLTLDGDRRQIVILTGPNMAGKSTYLRQNALIVLMAHAGSFVPAAEARIPITDRIWTRVGASDDLVAGDSTFMVEMKETAAILGNLTPRSLVVLDEIGRGTSTYDGIAIAWAVAEYLHDVEPVAGARPKTLFATHFHELVALADARPRIYNASVAVKEWRDEVLFLRRVVPGPASRSYGIAVARLAGVPDAVVARARVLLDRLERGCGVADTAGREVRATPQLELFAPRTPSLRDEIAALAVEGMTPLDALNALHALVERARKS